MMDESFNHQKQVNQKKLSETNAVYSQVRQPAGQEPTNSFASNYQVAKPSKRRRGQFDGSNVQMSSSVNTNNASPNR